MKLNAYTIFDVASGTYWKPIFAQSDGEILRTFKDISLDEEHPVGKHPEDYSLFRIGGFNDNTGEISADTKECMATALEMVAQMRSGIDGEKLKAISPGGTA